MVIDIVHIYAGTAGNAGSYLNEIFVSLKDNFRQKIFVNYYYKYPSQDSIKIFYKYSELSSKYILIKNNIRLGIRFLELFFALTYIFVFIYLNKVKCVNYNLTSDLSIEYYFLKLIKKFKNIKILITCHDVLPFGTKNKKLLEAKIHNKKRFFDSADYLIIHNESSKIDLNKYYDIDDKILFYPFPIMDLMHKSKNSSDKSNTIHNIQENVIRFSMIGHFRIEKGLDLLINAWQKFYNGRKKAELLIAGSFPDVQNYNLNPLKDKSVRIIQSFLTDEQYLEIILKSHAIILPYKRGTNSGIPSSVITANTLVLASDIPMFRNNPLISDEFLFKSEDVESLVEKLDWLYNMSIQDREHYIRNNRMLCIKYRMTFRKYINDIYNFLLI